MEASHNSQGRLLDAIWQKKVKEVVKVLLCQTQLLLLCRLDASLQTPHYLTHRVVLSWGRLIR